MGFPLLGYICFCSQLSLNNFIGVVSTLMQDYINFVSGFVIFAEAVNSEAACCAGLTRASPPSLTGKANKARS